MRRASRRHWLDAELRRRFPWVKDLSEAERYQFAKEYARAAWSVLEQRNIAVRWSVRAEVRRQERTATACLLRSTPDLSSGRSLSELLLLEERLRGRLRRRCGWSGLAAGRFPTAILDDHRSREDCRQLALTLARRRWQSPAMEPGERGHLLAEVAYLLGAHLGARAALADVQRHTGLSSAGVESVMRRHDEAVARGSCTMCLRSRNPAAPHRVYLAHFPYLGAYKVGVTHLQNDRRLRTHLAAGGVILETVTVPSWQDALAVERAVVEAVRPWRLPEADTTTDGITEMWSDKGPRVHLADYWPARPRRRPQ